MFRLRISGLDAEGVRGGVAWCWRRSVEAEAAVLVLSLSRIDEEERRRRGQAISKLELVGIRNRFWQHLGWKFNVSGYTSGIMNLSYHEVVLAALSIGRLNVESGELELNLPPGARLQNAHEDSETNSLAQSFSSVYIQ